MQTNDSEALWDKLHHAIRMAAVTSAYCSFYSVVEGFYNVVASAYRSFYNVVEGFYNVAASACCSFYNVVEGCVVP